MTTTLWTEADLLAVKAAYLQAGVDGVASASVGGQTIVGWNADQWEKLLSRIEAYLVSTTDGVSGLRLHKIKPRYE